MIMKKTAIILFLLLSGCLCASAQESCYITADRAHYRAGERLFCAVTARADDGSISASSGIAYVGLYSPEGLAASGKVELIDGRGGGEIVLPKSLATGNYLLLAWTCAGGRCGKTSVISIYNPHTTARVGEVIVSETIPSPDQAAPSRRSATIQLDERATVSVSLVRDCGLPRHTPVEGVRMAEPGSPEPDGEIISVRIGGTENYQGLEAFLAVPGSDQLYPAPIEKDGLVRFHTENIRGHKDVAFVIGKDDVVGNYTLSLLPPFPERVDRPVPSLTLTPSMKEAIATLGNVHLDTLDIRFPERKPASLYADPATRYDYILDDYTRFPTMRETLIEFVYDIRARKEDGKIRLSVHYREDVNGYYRFDKDRALVMLDGVPIFNHQLIYDYDPALVERIDVYRGVYFMGNNYFRGLANFVTFEKTLPGFRFGDDVKILELDGVSPVHAYAGGHETLYWNPLLTLEAGQPLEITPPAGAEGRFILTIDGFTDSGKPVHEQFFLSK